MPTNPTRPRRTNSPRTPEILITLHFSAAYLQKDFLPCDALCRAELELLAESYISKSHKFNALKSVTFDWYLCPRAHRLGLHSAHAYLKKLMSPETNLVCYLCKYNPKLIGYGWSKAGTDNVNRRLRKHFMAAICAGKTEITLFIPEKLLQPEHNHGDK